MLAYIPLQLFSRAFFLNISATSDDVLTISKFMLCCYKLILAQLKGFSLQNLLLKLCAFFVYRTVIVLAFICACAFMLCMLHLLICRIYIEVVITYSKLRSMQTLFAYPLPLCFPNRTPVLAFGYYIQLYRFAQLFILT